MALIDAALNRSRTVIATLVLLLLAGFIAYRDIPKESDPDINIPIVYVAMSHEGISPEDAERLLAGRWKTNCGRSRVSNPDFSRGVLRRWI